MERLIADLTGQAVIRARPLHGGDLSDVTLVTLADRRQVVAKIGPHVATEARMLQAMADTGAPVPAVVAQQGKLLLIQAFRETHATAHGWAALGEGLKVLHGAQAREYGWVESYAFGSVTISNTRCEDWPAFWATHRLLPLTPHLPAPLARRVEALATHLPDLIPARPAPALLHGDLWTGNVLFGEDRAYLIDPACYYGDAEVDLAMLELFGQPHPAFWSAYGKPAGDWATRRAVYQLWPALVHVALFGAGYHAMVNDRLSGLNS